jgi:hypothetical protein
MSSDLVSRKSAEIPVTTVVPWTDRLGFNEASFQRQVYPIVAGLTRHIHVFVTEGEGYAATEAQFHRIAKASWQVSESCNAADARHHLSVAARCRRTTRSYPSAALEFLI